MPEIFQLTKLSYVVILGASLMNLAVGIIEPLAGPYLENLGADESKIGTVISSRFLLVAIGSIPFALLASKIGNARVLFVSAFAALFSSTLLLYVAGIDGLHLFFILMGLAQAATSGPAAAILAENHGTKRIAAFSLFSISWMIPPALGAVISAVWFHDNPSFDPENVQTIFPLIASINTVGIIFFTILLMIYANHDTSAEHKMSFVNQFRIIFAPYMVVAVSMLIVVNFMSGAGAGATLPYLPLYLKRLGADASQISWLVVALNLAMGVATQFVAPLAKKFGQLQIFGWSQTLSIICLLSIVFTDDLLISSVFFILRGMFANMTVPITQSLTFEYIDSRVRATAAAVITNIRWIGWSIASPISGRIIGAYGFEVSFIFTSVLYIISTLMFIYVILFKPKLDDIDVVDRTSFNNNLYLVTTK